LNPSSLSGADYPDLVLHDPVRRQSDRILSPPLTTPKDKMVEQYRMVGELVMPHFRSRPAVQAAAK
jgi:hypothetical protein